MVQKVLENRVVCHSNTHSNFIQQISKPEEEKMNSEQFRKKNMSICQQKMKCV